MNSRRVACEVLAILAVAVCLGAIANMRRAEAHRLAWLRTEPSAAVMLGAATPAAAPHPVPVPDDPGAMYVEVSADTALKMHGSGVLFIDARRSSAYEAGHIAGAISIPVWEHDADVRIGRLVGQGVPFDREILVYCSGPTCEDSARLAEKLALAGFYRIRLYEDGFADWEKRGLPVAQGAKP